MMLRTYLYPLLLVSLSTGIVGFLCPDEDRKGGVRILCGAILALVLLSPLKDFVQMAEGLLPDGEDTVIQTEQDPEQMAIEIKKSAIEQALGEYLKSHYRLGQASVSLTIDAKDVSAVRIQSASIEGVGAFTQEEKEMICQAVRTMLGCEVYLEVKQDAK